MSISNKFTILNSIFMKTPFSIFLNPIIILFTFFYFSTDTYAQNQNDTEINCNSTGSTCDLEGLLDNNKCTIGIPDYGSYYQNGINYSDNNYIISNTQNGSILIIIQKNLKHHAFCLLSFFTNRINE